MFELSDKRRAPAAATMAFAGAPVEPSAGERAGRPVPPVLTRLRGEVARIEGRLAERLQEENPEADFVLPTGVAPFDEALSGGIPTGLTELRLDQTRDAGAGAGFALALAILAGADACRPLIWIGERHVFTEGGHASAAGLRTLGLDPAALLLVAPQHLEEAIWAGEEAARSRAPALVVLETRGNPKRLGLEGTRRLHVRAKESGRPFLMLRQAGAPETSAAPLRLAVSAHPGAPPGELGPGRFLGAPAFRIDIEKSRDGRTRQFLLEWNAHEQRLALLDRAPALSGGVAPETVHRPHPAREAGTLVALRRAS